MLLAGCGGLVSAGILASLLSGSVVGLAMSMFAPLPLLMVGFGVGSTAMPVALMIGVIAVTLVNGLMTAIAFAAVYGLPALLIVRQALSRRLVDGVDGRATPTGPWMPPGPILTTITGLAAFATAATALAVGASGPIEATIREALAAQFTMAEVPAEEAAAIAGEVAPLLVGIGAAGWAVSMVVNAIVAQALLAARGWNQRPTPRWSALVLPDWISWFLVGAAAVALVSGGDLRYVALNLAVVLMVPFFFLGLGVIHTTVATLSARGPLLFGLYLLLGLFFLGVAPVIALIGIAEQWVGLRRRPVAATSE